MPRHLTRAVAPVLLVVCLAASLAAQSPFGGSIAAPFESYLELLRQQAGIPGLSAAIVQDGQIVWERGFGYQDLEARIPATPDTPYLVGDVTQTLAAVLLLQCVEIRRMALDDPVSRFNVTLEPGATLRQALSHAVPGQGGDEFRYDPERFSKLTFAVEWCAPQSYRKSVSHRLLERLAMKDSVPGRDLSNKSVVPEEQWDPAILDRYQRVLARLAVPYRVDRRGRPSRSDGLPLETINAATGLVSTVRDLARFDAAVDDEILLKAETRQIAWRNATGREGTLPTGLGWFVQQYRNQQIVWHFGQVPHGYSSLVVKIPSRRLTLILLANSDGLVAPYQLYLGDVTRSIFANLFLRLVA